MPTDGSTHLPSCLTRSDVYELAREDLSQDGTPVCSRSTFFELWRREFQHMKIPPENRFTKCDVCSAIREARMRTLDPAVRKWLTQVMEKHAELVMAERGKYKKHQHKAQKHPGLYMSVIIDGMDQSKTALPHIPSNPKSLAGQFTLPTHLTGVHAHGRLTIVLVDWGQFPHDSNLTITAILHIMLRYKDNLPPNLYLQLDNTCRENKNKYVLTFAAILVEMGIFSKVKLGFLPVGHTHEDIDMVFSCVSRGIINRTLLTIPDLMDATRKSFTPVPEVVELTQIFDFKEWMSSVTPALHDHVKAHQFKFVRVESGATHVRMFYKQWSTDEVWLPVQGIDLLEGELPVLTAPKTVSPTIAADDLRKLSTTINKIEGYLEKSGAKKWWDDWLNDAESLCSNEDGGQSVQSQGDWPLGVIKASHHQPRATQLPSAQLSPALSTEQTSSAINIPGIGEIPSSWVGLTGKRCLGRLLEQEELQPVVKMLKRDIHKLATTCQKALKKLGAEKSCDREVSVALELCGHYASAKTERGCKATRIQELWVNQDEDNTASPMKNAQDRAKQAIGEKLVNVITQQGKQRPDIYIGNLRGQTAIRHNTDVEKELKAGSIIAVNHPQWIGEVPQIAIVESVITLSSTLTITISWMDQERAPHKPRWLRTWHKSSKFPQTTINVSNILLYDITLTNKGALKKVTREYLQKEYIALQDTEWKDVLPNKPRKKRQKSR